MTLLPVFFLCPKSTFSTTAIYECRQDNGSTYQQLTMNTAATKAKLDLLMHGIQSTQHQIEHLKLDCMPDMELSMDSPYFFKDQRIWCENTPAKVGLYHCFMRTTAQNMREHKIFIVVSGNCRHASEELYNMWLDTRHDITVRQFVSCAEIDWLRKATLRHHSRLAARVAQALNLNVDFIEDVSSVDGASMLLPSTSCVTRDIMLTGGLNGCSGYLWALEIQDPTDFLEMSFRLPAEIWGSQRTRCAIISFSPHGTKKTQ